MTLVILVVEVDLLIFTEGVITSLCVTQDSQAHTSSDRIESRLFC